MIAVNEPKSKLDHGGLKEMPNNKVVFGLRFVEEKENKKVKLNGYSNGSNSILALYVSVHKIRKAKSKVWFLPSSKQFSASMNTPSCP